LKIKRFNDAVRERIVYKIRVMKVLFLLFALRSKFKIKMLRFRPNVL